MDSRSVSRMHFNQRWSYGNHRSYSRCNTERGAVYRKTHGVPVRSCGVLWCSILDTRVHTPLRTQIFLMSRVLYPWYATAHAPHTQYLRTITPQWSRVCCTLQLRHTRADDARTHARTHTDTTYKHARMYSPARPHARPHARTHAHTAQGGQGGSALRPASTRLPSLLPPCSRRRRRPPSADTCVETRAPQGAVVRA